MSRWPDPLVHNQSRIGNVIGRDRGAPTVGRSTPGGHLVARLLPTSTKAALAGPPRPKVKGVCPTCGYSSMNQLPGGECPDDVACAERAVSWGDL